VYHSDVSRYSRLYIERGARAYPHAQDLLAAFSNRDVIEIASAAELFYRRNQEFALQKRRPALIAAVANEPFLYQTPDFVGGDSEMPVLYSDQLRNCLFDCSYCFLQGMNQSANLLVQVNTDDYHQAARERAREGPFWLSISYLSDILAFEKTLPLVRGWTDVLSGIPEMTLEVRTKGTLPQTLLKAEQPANLVVTWTVSPPEIAGRYEQGAASVSARLAAARSALEHGIRVRLALDPVLLVPGWRALYSNFIAEHVAPLATMGLEAASYGPFRAPSRYLDVMKRMRADAAILHHPFTETDGISGYSDAECAAIDEVVGTRLRGLLPVVQSFT
jgi:spore photoproduct lyase